jgi:hypothetical protein
MIFQKDISGQVVLRHFSGFLLQVEYKLSGMAWQIIVPWPCLIVLSYLLPSWSRSTSSLILLPELGSSFLVVIVLPLDLHMAFSSIAVWTHRSYNLRRSFFYLTSEISTLSITVYHIVS